LNRDQKAAVIAEVAGQLREAEAVYAVDYRGTSVPQAAELRTRLRDADTRFRVVKNTLTERAADDAGAEALKPYLEGPTALVFVGGDAAVAAKTLSDFSRANGLLTFKGGWMGGEVLSAEQIDAIAKLPARDVLYGRLVGMVASPITGLASALGGLVGGLARQLQQMADQGLVGGDAPAAAPIAETTAAEDPDAGPATTSEEPGPDPDPAPNVAEGEREERASRLAGETDLTQED
jgi:large subunit ribosomal protein L10